MKKDEAVDQSTIDYQNRRLEEDISIHIFTASAALVGVCLTVIGLIRVIISIRAVKMLADDLLAVDSLFFLMSCLLSYVALRTRKKKRMHRIEQLADGIFIVAMVLMVISCGFITFEISHF